MTRRTYAPTRAYESALPVPKAYNPTRDLMTSLANSGWGELRGRDMQGVRTTLQALVAHLPYGSGAGRGTVDDIVTRAGLSRRWVARCLHLLEDLGVLEWTRGGITVHSASKRTGTPGWFRIVKTRLVELILAARPANDERQAEIRKATLERIHAIKTKYTRTKIKNQHRRRSDHVALSDHPTPLTGGTGGSGPRQEVISPSTDSNEVAALPALEAAQAPRAEIYQANPKRAAIASRGAALAKAALAPRGAR